jgi:uncharacterized membrane protein YeaQ/YmgE (transglycosylase-associated protein family)
MDPALLGWLLIGLAIGVLVKLIVRGVEPGGFVVSILIGIVGALLAGVVMRAIGDGGWPDRAAAASGAVVLLALYRVVVMRRMR